MPAYTLDERSIRRIQAMLRWYESVGHPSPPPSSQFVYDEGDTYAAAWEIKSIVINTLILTNCMYMRGPVTVFLDDLSVELSGTDTIVSAKIDTENGETTLVFGGLGVAYDVAVLEDSKYYLLPLYKLIRETANDSWVVDVDYRNCPQLAVYV